MIPYPGESLGLQDAARITTDADFDLWQAIWHRGAAFDGAPTSATLAAGETWRMWTWDNDLDYLDTVTPDLVVSWVVEVLSGSATVAASEGIDLDYAGDPMLTATPTSLGTVTLTAGTNVLPSTTSAAHVKGDGLTNQGAPVLNLTALSGSVDVQQVKMRVWPATGPAGAWVEHPSWQTSPAPPAVYLPQLSSTNVQNVSARADTYEDSWDAAGGAAVDGPPVGTYEHRSVSVTPTGAVLITGSGAAQQILTELTPAIATSVQTLSGLAAAAGPDWSLIDPIDPDLTDGADYSRPPAEVRFDADHHSQTIGAGGVAWGGAVASWEVSGGTPMGAMRLYTASADAVPIETVVIGPGDTKHDVTLTVGAGVELTGSAGSVALPTGSRFIVAALTHSFLSNPEPWPGTGGGVFGGPIYGLEGAVSLGSDEDPLRAWVLMPAFRVWVPSATTTRRSVVRHGVRNDGLISTAPRRWGQVSSFQSGRGGGYQ